MIQRCRLSLVRCISQNVTGFLARLSKVRGEQMVPLSTASLEQGSYQRGYEYIVRCVRTTLLKMGRYYNTTMRHCWDMLVK